VSFIGKIGSALGKLLIVATLAAAFLLGMGFVVYRSLQGSEITVPEVVGKNFVESEKELEALGLRIKKRADRYSEEAPNTVLEQLPKPGDTVKTGQLILVVTSKPNPEGDEKPTTIKKGNIPVEDDSEKIEELISDKPKKKTNSNVNTNKKKASTSRDVIKDNSNSDSNSSNSNKDSSDSNSSSTKDNKNASIAPAKTPATTGTPRPTTNKTPPTSGDTRPRRNP
jgi:beta-lactam-binding protein with PASTA domain